MLESRSRSTLVWSAIVSLVLVTAAVWHIARSDPGSAAEASGAGGAGALIASARVYPDGAMGKDVAVLTTKTRSLRRTWRQFEMPGYPPRVDFDRHQVLFAGTGESSTCPQEFRRLERVEGKRLVKVHVNYIWGSACTDDWVPRTFVIGAGKKHFPRGEFDVRIGYGKRITVDSR